MTQQKVQHSKELLSILDRFPGTPMLVVGDLILDHYIWGKVRRISPEAPVVVVELQEENKRPGGAGNVASNLSSLGANAEIVGVIGNDQHGAELLSALTGSGVQCSGLVTDPARPTTVKTRVIAHSQQVVRVDRELTKPVSDPVSVEIVTGVNNRLASVKGMVVSDYGKGAVQESLFRQIRQWKLQGRVGGGVLPVVVDPKAPNFSMYAGATVIKPNRGEAEEAAGETINNRQDAAMVAERLLRTWGCEQVLVTLGEDGMVLVSADGPRTLATEIDTVAREVYDVSGAGDTVSAVFSLALAVGATAEQAARIANVAAGIVVAEVGTVAVSLDQLRSAIISS